MKRCISLLLIIFMLSGMSIVSFAESRTILALGDSISAGYGLSDREAECFVSLMADASDTVINKAVDGNEADDIIDQLTNKENENYISEGMIKDADIVTITCGGNDMMELLYEKIAQEYTNVHPRKQKITADQVLGKMAEGNVYAIAAALHVLDKDDEVYYLNDGEFDVRLGVFIENLLWITEYIKSINPDVKIVVATQYNPYVEFSTVTTFDVVYLGMEEGSTKLNEAIISNCNKGGYTVADVKNAFDEFAGDEDLYNANPDIDYIDFDFHPTKAGHTLIAEVFGKIINNLHRLGIENEDGTYSLPDNVLGYYIADNSGAMRFVNAGVYEANEGDVIEPVYMNVNMVNGAQVKLTGSGLRFLAIVDRSSYDAVNYGMKITCAGSEEEIFVDAQKWQSDACFSVAIENMAVENYTRNYTAVPFARVRYDNGEEKVICASQSVTRSIYIVAKGLLEGEEDLEENVRIILNAYVRIYAET